VAGNDRLRSIVAQPVLQSRVQLMRTASYLALNDSLLPLQNPYPLVGTSFSWPSNRFSTLRPTRRRTRMRPHVDEPHIQLAFLLICSDSNRSPDRTLIIAGQAIASDSQASVRVLHPPERFIETRTHPVWIPFLQQFDPPRLVFIRDAAISGERWKPCRSQPATKTMSAVQISRRSVMSAHSGAQANVAEPKVPGHHRPL
jgi:hypothetical protein